MQQDGSDVGSLVAQDVDLGEGQGIHLRRGVAQGSNLGTCRRGSARSCWHRHWTGSPDRLGRCFLDAFGWWINEYMLKKDSSNHRIPLDEGAVLEIMSI
jgi:hypothetical protein